MAKKYNKTKRKEFSKELVKIASDFTGCSIQHGNCPCNTCFHSLMKDIGLSTITGHMLWLVILSLRGDYTEKELFANISNKEMFKGISK